MAKNDFFTGVKSVSEHIESQSKIQKTHKKNHEKLTVRGGGGGKRLRSAWGRKISVSFDVFPYMNGYMQEIFSSKLGVFFILVSALNLFIHIICNFPMFCPETYVHSPHNQNIMFIYHRIPQNACTQNKLVILHPNEQPT